MAPARHEFCITTVVSGTGLLTEGGGSWRAHHDEGEEAYIGWFYYYIMMEVHWRELGAGGKDRGVQETVVGPSPAP